MLKYFPISIPGVSESGIIRTVKCLSVHVKMCLFDIRGWFASDYLYPFFKFDCMSKSRLRVYASKHCVQVGNLTECLERKDNDPYLKYGTEVPCSVSGSAMEAGRGQT